MLLGLNIGVCSLMQQVLVEHLVCSRCCASFGLGHRKESQLSDCVFGLLWNLQATGWGWRNLKAQEDWSSRVLEPSEDQKTCE